MKWETPARSAFSSRDPAPIQKPIATERTWASRSEITRSPESSSVSTYFCTGGSYSGVSPSSEGCLAPITPSGMAAVAFETALDFQHRLRIVPNRETAFEAEESLLVEGVPAANAEI